METNLVRFVAKKIGEHLDETELPLPTTEELVDIIERAVLEWKTYTQAH